MKRRLLYIVIGTVVVILLFIVFTSVNGRNYILRAEEINENASVWNEQISKNINSSDINIVVDGTQIEIDSSKYIYMSDSLTLMIQKEILTEAFDCAVNFYNDSTLVIEKGKNSISAEVDSDEITIDDDEVQVDESVTESDDIVYVPAEILVDGLGYEYSWDSETNTATFTQSDEDVSEIPYYYNYALNGRIPEVGDQGYYGTCWAFAALEALETTLLPEESFSFSVEHMTLCNSFNMTMYDGGDYTMSLAYLAAWQGPVLEEDDPYGDGETDDTLEAVKHVQEAQIITSKDYTTIKEMIFKYGAVQSSLYTSMSSNSSYSTYYNSEDYAYCYVGTEDPNHDIIIIGWDDDYPKENFSLDIEGDGAFICMNSWGSDFGDDGIFYVSYYDSNIGVHNIVYTDVEDTDNYDNIYQYDYCGWVGQLGYGDDTAYFASVYEAESDEDLKAVSFYATGADTEYSIYVCSDFEDTSSLNIYTSPVAEGTLANAGYYTIDLDADIALEGGTDFAIIVKITTEGSERPVAVEFSSDYFTEDVSLEGKESYLSLRGLEWENTQEEHECTVCLKAFTDD